MEIVWRKLDYHTGRVLDTIEELGLADNTLIIFTLIMGHGTTW